MAQSMKIATYFSLFFVLICSTTVNRSTDRSLFNLASLPFLLIHIVRDDVHSRTMKH
jgi:hypothetical protein